MVLVRVIDSQQLSCVATTIIAMSNCYCSNEQTNAKDWLLHSDRLSSQPDWIQVKNSPSEPDPYETLGPASSFSVSKLLAVILKKGPRIWSLRTSFWDLDDSNISDMVGIVTSKLSSFLFWTGVVLFWIEEWSCEAIWVLYGHLGFSMEKLELAAIDASSIFIWDCGTLEEGVGFRNIKKRVCFCGESGTLSRLTWNQRSTV